MENKLSKMEKQIIKHTTYLCSLRNADKIINTDGFLSAFLWCLFLTLTELQLN